MQMHTSTCTHFEIQKKEDMCSFQESLTPYPASLLIYLQLSYFYRWPLDLSDPAKEG